MSYFYYLKRLLEPLGIYDLDSGVGMGELQAVGNELDKVFDELEKLCREGILQTAREYGIKNYESILPYKPAYITTEDARRAIMALLRIRGGSFTLNMLQDTLSGCGISAAVSESGRPMTVLVSFPENRGIPNGFEKIKARIDEIMPCHLEIVYVFTYSTWIELMERMYHWTTIESENLTWRKFEIFT